MESVGRRLGGVVSPDLFKMLLFCGRELVRKKESPATEHGNGHVLRPREVSMSARSEPVAACASGVIPKLIFQTWKTRDELPSNYSRWSSTFSALNPGYEHLIWDDADNRDFIAKKFPWFLSHYDAYPREIFRADIIRYFFLYEYGGMYVDMDTECLRPLNELKYSGDVILGRMGRDESFPHSIPNAIMASAPRQLFWLLVISMAMELLQQHLARGDLRAQGPEWMTGPVLLKSAHDYYVSHDSIATYNKVADVVRNIGAGYSVYPGNVEVLAPERWYPVDWNNRIHQIFRRAVVNKKRIPEPAESRWLFPRSDVVTYWTHSW